MLFRSFDLSLFVIADLHLSLSINKPMDIFGGWDDYMNRVRTNWQAKVKDGDTVVLPGDFSWATKLEDTLEDFRFLASLPGEKIMLKGNHDYWWSTVTKMENFFEANGIERVKLLHNNFYPFGGTFAGVLVVNTILNVGVDTSDTVLHFRSFL